MQGLRVICPWIGERIAEETAMTTATTDLSRLGVLKIGPYGGRIRSLLALFMTCLEVAQQRRELRALDGRMLRDIGVRRLDAKQEADRGFWDLPDA